MRRWALAVALVALLGCAVAQDEEAAPEVGDDLNSGCPFEITVPWTYSKEITVDMSENVKVEDEDPLALTTVCTCPKTEGVSTTCTCEGPREDDCDAYAQLLAAAFLTSEKFMGVFMHMDSMSSKYHVENVAFWTILGQIFSWLGFVMILYSEIKTVIIVREKDERDRLVMLNYLKRNEEECARLTKLDEEAMIPRPYITLGGLLAFWIGLLFQFTPFCHVMGLIFPGLEMFNDLCIVFVLIGTLILAASFFLVLVGLLWSCTRRWAAFVLIVLGLLGDVMVFGGLVSIIVWLAVTVGVLYAYFKWAPEHFEEEGKEYPSWLEDLGNIVRVGGTYEDFTEAMSKGGDALGKESRGVVASFPGGKKALELSDQGYQAVKDGVDSVAGAKEEKSDTELQKSK